MRVYRSPETDQTAGTDGNTSRYGLTPDGFQIIEYDTAPPFTSFLPGLSGTHGIPVWVYTCNRGQAISSLGVHHKGNALMEFHPANIAYEKTAQEGFRTFIRTARGVTEPFSPQTRARRVMTLSENTLEITETNRQCGLETRVAYCTLPDAPLGALMRGVQVTNLSDTPQSVEVLDGLPRVIPYGLELGAFREMANLFKSWAEVSILERGAALYTLRSSTDDSAQVTDISGAFFYCGASRGELLPVLYDPQAIFGEDTALSMPRVFERGGLDGVRGEAQCAVNRIACGFVGGKRLLASGESIYIDSYIGFTPSAELLSRQLPCFASAGYAEDKRRRARAITDELLRDVKAVTAMPVLDKYIGQCYLDNFLRGGYAMRVGTQLVHLYSRKHGDPERDYNWFALAGEPYSQGNGNFRDVCQNRRLDVMTHPFVGDTNVHAFFSLVQADGFNPLEIRPTTFTVRDPGKARALLREATGAPCEALEALLAEPFTPGRVAAALAKADVRLTMSEDALLCRLLAQCEPHVEAVFGEGYWSDHFDYLLDLIEDYLRVYPDKKHALLHERRDYAFFDSGAVVRPLSACAQKTPKGIRRYGSLDTSRAHKSAAWLKDASGSVVHTTLMGKLLTLAVTKTAQLDPEGLGIWMDGGKPGWNDAMNGLPGLFGSGLPETLELSRLLTFMLEAADGDTPVPEELAALLDAITQSLQSPTPFERWQAATEALEAYRARVAQAVSGRVRVLRRADLLPFLRLSLSRAEEGIRRAMALGGGIMPTYMTYEVTAYEDIVGEGGAPRLSEAGYPLVRPTAFRGTPAPLFLEGPARYLAAPAARASKDAARHMTELVLDSGLYDKKLGMYMTSEQLDDMSLEFGRIRAFTPGWLERESVFVHMEYKYLLGLIKAGFTEAFYQAAKTALIPMLDPAVYGRSTLENCSFIASSRNPDPRVRGRGFVSRLSGSTIEALSIWQALTVGDGGYAQHGDALVFRFDPRLAGALFDERGEAAFTLHSGCEVVYHNESRRDTFGTRAAQPARIEYELDGQAAVAQGDTLPDGTALREGRISRVYITLA